MPNAGSNSSECGASLEEMASAVEMDTWSWVNAAMAADARLSREQCEVLVSAAARISSYRLSTWQRSATTPHNRLFHALHMSSEHTLDACRKHAAALATAEAEARAVAARISGEVQAAGDVLRDTAAGVRTDTALGVGALRVEGREAVQRGEGELHRLRGELVSAAAAFRAGAEHAKARATSLFTGLLGLSLLLVVVERTLLS